MSEKYTSILEFGAENTGAGNLSCAFEKAFAAGVLDLYLPRGMYRLDHTVLLPSHAHVLADAEAIIFANPGGFRDYCMFRNADAENGNEDISLSGGVWDGRCDVNVRESYKDNDFVGLMFTFNNVKNLSMTNMRLRDGICYYIRLGEVRDFLLDNIRFEGTRTPGCQDGIHVGGGSENGRIRNIWAEPGSLGDDLVAFNADDVFWYAHNWGMKALPIRHMTVENVQAEHCFTGVRLLSVEQEISDIHFRNLRIGYRMHGINLDAARHCADPIPELKNYPNGVGNMWDITFENVELWYAGTGKGRECITFETNPKSMTFTNLSCPRVLEKNGVHPLFRFGFMGKTELNMDGETVVLASGETMETKQDGFGSVTVRNLD